MGLFSSKKKTKVGTSNSRIIEDKMLPNANRKGVLTSVMKERPIADSIQRALYESIGFNADRMYDYAKKKYTYGLPSGQFHYASQGIEKVKAILEAKEKAPISMIYSRLGPYNFFHYLNQVGLDSIHKIPPSGTFETIPNANFPKIKRTAYYTNLTIAVPQALVDEIGLSSVADWGAPQYRIRNWYIPPNNHVISDGTKPELRINYFTINPGSGYSFMDGYVAPTEEPGYLTYPLDMVPLEGDYFQACYQLTNGTVKFWTYKLGEGTYPELDKLHNALPTTGGTFFPFAYFRYAKSSMKNQKGTAAYKTTERMLKKLGMSLADTVEAIHKNPDIKDIEQAMFYMAVPGVTKDPMEARYLFDFFTNVYHAKGRLPGMPEHNVFGGLYARQLLQHAEQNLGQDTGLHTGAFSIADKRFKMSLTNEGIFKRLVVGSIGKVGTYDCIVDDLRNVPKTISDKLMGTALYDTFKYSGLSTKYRKQVSTQVYEEVQVLNPGLTYHIYDEHTETGNLKYQEAYLVPIDKSITKNYSLADRERIYARSLHYVFNSRIVTRVKWYQQGWFSIFIIIVAIVISILTWNPQVAASAIATTAGTTAMALIIIEAIVSALIRFAIVTAAKLVLKEVAPEILTALAAVIAVVAIIYGMPEGLDSVPWAEHLLEASSVLMSVGQANTQNLIKGLQVSATAFMDEAEQKMKLLEDTQDLLYNDPILIPLVVFGETPQDFYRRTVHSGNVGTLAIKSVSTYVRRSLTLPTVQQTLGAIYV